MTQLTWEKTLLSLSSWVYNIFGTAKRNLFVALCFVDSPAERNALHPSMKKKPIAQYFRQSLSVILIDKSHANLQTSGNTKTQNRSQNLYPSRFPQKMAVRIKKSPS